MHLFEIARNLTVKKQKSAGLSNCPSLHYTLCKSLMIFLASNCTEAQLNQKATGYLACNVFGYLLQSVTTTITNLHLPTIVTLLPQKPQHYLNYFLLLFTNTICTVLLLLSFLFSYALAYFTELPN